MRRMRITSDGRLKPCLMRNDDLIDILTPVKAEVSREELDQLFREAINRREPYFQLVV